MSQFSAHDSYASWAPAVSLTFPTYLAYSRTGTSARSDLLGFFPRMVQSIFPSIMAHAANNVSESINKWIKTCSECLLCRIFTCDLDLVNICCASLPLSVSISERQIQTKAQSYTAHAEQFDHGREWVRLILRFIIASANHKIDWPWCVCGAKIKSLSRALFDIRIVKVFETE